MDNNGGYLKRCIFLEIIQPAYLFQLDPYMDESFVSMAFKQMGVAVKGIKVIKSKTTGYKTVEH